MNINEIKVDDFGVWHDLTLDDLGSGVTVFYGLNGAGKTTLLNVIRSVLYGFSEKRCAKYFPPVHSNQANVSMLVADTSGEYRLTRTAPSKYRGGDGSVSILSTQGNQRGKELLTSMLAGVDETIFNNVFAVGLSQIQKLASLSNTEAASQLYGLAAGVDRVSIFDVARDLETQREEILPSDAESGRIDMLLEQKSRLQKELKALRRDSGVHAKMRREYAELIKQLKEKEKSKWLLERKGSWVEQSGSIRKNWHRCRQINDRLSEFTPVPEVPKHIASRVTSSFEQVKKLRREWSQLSDERKRVKAKAAKYRGRDALYRHAAEIQALERQRPRIVSLEEEVKRGQQQVEEFEFEVQAEMEALGLEAGTQASRLPPISDDVLHALQGPARDTDDLRETVEATKKMASMYEDEAQRIKSELDTASVRFGGEDIGLALQKRTAIVQSLEERMGLDQHRESMVRQIDEIEDEARHWLSKTVLPWSGILTVCGIFSFGVMLMLAGFLHSWFELITVDHRSLLLIIGGAVSAISLVMKNGLESNAIERADICRQQMMAMREEHEVAAREAEELERSLTQSGGGNPDQMLIDARNELAELSQFLPLTQRYETLSRQAEVAEAQANEAVRQLKESRRAWKASLRSVGLPDSLTPDQIEQMSGRISDVSRIRQRIADSQRSLREREQELSTIRDRIEQLLTVGQIHPVPDGLGAKLSRLNAELDKHSKAGREREQLKHRWLQLGESQKRLSNSAQQVVRNRQQLLDSQGITGLADFRQSIQQSRKSAKLRRERDRRLQKISEQTNGDYSAKRLQSMLDNRSNKLIEKLKDLDRKSQSLDAELKSLHQRTANLKTKLDGQMQDRRVEQKELAVQCLDEKISQLYRRWQRSALVSHISDQVKQNYETKRQPVALAESSRHLERLTEGEYTRIWTPMGQSSLCVDDRNGQALPVERLSRGTRELVFLALRFALVSSYNRRGANMPIILDDVFVNLDDRRAPAVAKVLAELGDNGQQILIFTCHERIRRIFCELGKDVRDLPQRNGGSAGVATRVDYGETASQPMGNEAAPAPMTEQVEPLIVEEPVVIEKPVIIEKVVELQIPSTKSLAELDLHEDRLAPKSVDEFDQFTPAWRDEWLEPLPDIAAANDNRSER